MLVADRLDVLVKTVYDGYQNYDGTVISVAAVGYTIQLYMEFSGCMDIVIGTGEIFGITLPENFRRPFSQRPYRNSGEDGILRWEAGLKNMCFIRYLCGGR